MSDLDQRVTNGLRELVGRAPVDADVWQATERYVAKHRRHRHTLTAAVVAVAFVGGGVLTAAVVRDDGSKAVVSNPGVSTDTTSPGSSGPWLPATGPIEGSFTITAQPAAALTFAPSALTVNTGIYAVTLVDGADTTHTLAFDDPTTLWSQLLVNTLAQTQTSRIFFGHPGTYTFYCTVAGHRAAGMQGVVTVTGPPITLAQAETEGTPSRGSSANVDTTPASTST
jgi:plastocyanin